jgi:hypothetical protein
MNSVLVIYPPGAGGNHLKNMLCLGNTFANRHELNIDVYDIDENSNRCPGEVWCVGGRNVQPIFVDRIFDGSSKRYVMPAHFGELASWHHRFSGSDVGIILINIDQQQDRLCLMNRQVRLGQHIHPYWLDEELLFLYQPRMMQIYFGFNPEKIVSIPLSVFWSRDFVSDETLYLMTRQLDLDLPMPEMMVLHHKWYDLNFDTAVDKGPRPL